MFQQGLSLCLLPSDEEQRLTCESKSDNQQALADRKLESLFLCPAVTTFLGQLRKEFSPRLSIYFLVSISCGVLFPVLFYL